MRELGTDAGIVEAGADRMRLRDLAVLGLEDVRTRPVEHPGFPLRERRAVLARLQPEPAGFDAVEGDRRLRDESVQRSDGVRSAAYAGDHRVGKPPFHARDLLRDLL